MSTQQKTKTSQHKGSPAAELNGSINGSQTVVSTAMAIGMSAAVLGGGRTRLCMRTGLHASKKIQANEDSSVLTAASTPENGGGTSEPLDKVLPLSTGRSEHRQGFSAIRRTWSVDKIFPLFAESRFGGARSRVRDPPRARIKGATKTFCGTERTAPWATGALLHRLLSLYKLPL